tara:strand:+ start:3381 stop:3632 length:252 start_codon:yes stop_codon:yes gene_type:complete
MQVNPTTEQWFSVADDISRASALLTAVSDRLANGMGFSAHWTGGDTSDTQHPEVIELRATLKEIKVALAKMSSKALDAGVKTE